MADVTQTTTWQFKIDFTDLNEFEQRIRKASEMQKQLERGIGGNPLESINRAGQEARGVDMVTAAYDRQKRAIDSLEAAKRRAGRDTGVIHGPMPRPIAPRDTGVHFAPAGGPVNPAAQHAMWMAVNRSQVGLHGSNAPEFMMPGFPNSPHPMMQTRQQQIDAMRASILARHFQANERTTMDAAFFDSALGGRSFSRMDPLSGGRAGFSGMSTYGGLSPATIAMMNQRQAGGLRFTSGVSSLSSFGQAAVGLNMAFNPDMDPMGRFGGALWGGMELGAGVHHASRAMGGRALMGSMAMRAGGPLALAIGLGLEGSRRYHQGEADYQSAIGSRLDYQAGVNNWTRDRGTAIDSLNRGFADQRRGLYGNLRDVQFGRQSDLVSERGGFEAARLGTYGDIVERVNERKKSISAGRTEQALIQRNITFAQQQLAKARTPEEKRAAQRTLAEQNEKFSAASQNMLGLIGGQRSDAAAIYGANAEAAASLADIDARIRNNQALTADPDVVADRARRAKAFAETERMKDATGLSRFTAEQAEQRFGEAERLQIGQIERGTGAARRANDQAGLNNELASLSQQQIDELKTLNENFNKLFQEIGRKPAPAEKPAFNRAVDTAGVGLGIASSGFNAALNFITGGE